MTSPIPAPIAIPLSAFIAVVVIGRLVGDINSDLRGLLALARRWPRAKKAFQRKSPGIQPVS
ncbi:hypothetical protein [Nocardia amamiensis]|uniref:hypothetical protein n=1 Tax=Nocardia amamiensis TaxID=404578 RepID=UPI00082D5539|nr:hypothetical protein [Nocardia amamiensis]